MDPHVSVWCATYNQVDYLEKALDGFAIQQTDFPFEVVVHDDASTDGTTELLERYAAKHPDLIRPLYEQVNQNNLVSRYMDVFLFPGLTSKYVAICEGDDFWTDPIKLQKQYDYMEAHPDCSLCVTGFALCDDAGNPVEDSPNASTLPDYERDYSVEEIIAGGGELFATASMFFRLSDALEMPAWYFEAPVGDYSQAICLALRGRVHLIPDVTCTYRTMAKGSWSATESLRLNSGVNGRLIKMYRAIDEYTGGAYHAALEERIVKTCEWAYTNREIDVLLDESLAPYFDRLDPAIRKKLPLVRLLGRLGLTLIQDGSGHLGLKSLPKAKA